MKNKVICMKTLADKNVSKLRNRMKPNMKQVKQNTISSPMINTKTIEKTKLKKLKKYTCTQKFLAKKKLKQKS